MAATHPDADILVSVAVKGGERFIIRYEDTLLSRARACAVAWRWADDPALSFNREDAARFAGEIQYLMLPPSEEAPAYRDAPPPCRRDASCGDSGQAGLFTPRRSQAFYLWAGCFSIFVGVWRWLS